MIPAVLAIFAQATASLGYTLNEYHSIYVFLSKGGIERIVKYLTREYKAIIICARYFTE